MVSHDDIRGICNALPGSIEGSEQFGFGVMVKGKHKGFCWTWPSESILKSRRSSTTVFSR